jgi:hypothetical protein
MKLQRIDMIRKLDPEEVTAIGNGTAKFRRKVVAIAW